MKKKTIKQENKIVSKQHISFKLLRVLLPMIVIAFIMITAFLVTQAGNIIMKLSKAELKEETISMSNFFSGDINTFIGKLDTMAITLENFKFDSDEDLLNFLTEKSTQFSSNAPNGIYLALDDGTWIDPSGWVPDEDYVAADRPWYQDGIKNDTFKLGKPYLDSVTNSMVVPIARKITLADGRSGVASTDMSLAMIVESVGQFKPMEKGTAILLDGDAILSCYKEEYNGTLISEHSDDKLLGSIVNASSTQDTVTELKDSGDSYFVVSRNVEGTSWLLISTVLKNDVLSELLNFMILGIIIGVVVLVLISVIMFMLISKIITSPVNKLTSSIVDITNNDFTIELEDLGEDEIGLMNSNIKKFVKYMRDSLIQIRNESIRLLEEAEDSKSASEIMSSQAKEQSNSMENIRDAMDGMASAVSELAENATQLATMISDLTDEGNKAESVTKELLEKAKDGRQDLKVVANNMDTISGAMTEMNGVVHSVEESANKISEIVEMINSIAGQTNLLSLNASIEAARAGEAGKGFAVVATEIGSLAKDSAEASQKISEIINEIVKQVENLSQKSQSSMRQIADSSSSVTVAASTFKDIFNNLDITGQSMQKMIAMMCEVNNIAMSVAAISEEQSASTEEVSATVETVAISANQVADESENVSKSALTVSKSAETIDKFVATFKVD